MPKNSDAKTIRDHKQTAQTEKKRLKKMQIIKQIELIDRKKKRKKIKIQKKIKTNISI